MRTSERNVRWRINDVVFGSQMWSTYEPLLRADFRASTSTSHG